MRIRARLHWWQRSCSALPGLRTIQNHARRNAKRPPAGTTGPCSLHIFIPSPALSRSAPQLSSSDPPYVFSFRNLSSTSVTRCITTFVWQTGPAFLVPSLPAAAEGSTAQKSDQERSSNVRLGLQFCSIIKYTPSKTRTKLFTEWLRLVSRD